MAFSAFFVTICAFITQKILLDSFSILRILKIHVNIAAEHSVVNFPLFICFYTVKLLKILVRSDNILLHWRIRGDSAKLFHQLLCTAQIHQPFSVGRIAEQSSFSVSQIERTGVRLRKRNQMVDAGFSCILLRKRDTALVQITAEDLIGSVAINGIQCVLARLTP